MSFYGEEEGRGNQLVKRNHDNEIIRQKGKHRYSSKIKDNRFSSTASNHVQHPRCITTLTPPKIPKRRNKAGRITRVQKGVVASFFCFETKKKKERKKEKMKKRDKASRVAGKMDMREGERERERERERTPRASVEEEVEAGRAACRGHAAEAERGGGGEPEKRRNVGWGRGVVRGKKKSRTLNRPLVGPQGKTTRRRRE